MYQQTSRLAYEELVSTGQISKRQAQVLNAFVEYPFPMTNQDVSNYTKLPINCVTPRVLELRDRGLLQKAYVKKEGRPAIAWKIAYDIAL
jgi:CRP-like cAMP-binding protein